MAQSLSKIYIHLIFHIKTTSPAIRQEDIERVHCYVGQLVNTTGCKVVRVGGVNDHVHILFLLSRDVAISHVVEEIKRNSSRWIKTLATHYRAFAWQNGYGVFSISQSLVDKTLDYISNQEMHHKRFSFQDEYRQFLLSYGVEFDEAYVFKDEGFCSFRASSHIAMYTQGVASLALGMCSIGPLLTSSAAAQQFKQA